jgi:hypothetical protein
MPVGDSAPNAEGVRSILYAPMRRRLIQLSLFLLLGAIINVAVAWTAAILESSDGSLDCMIEGGLFHPEERSRYADAGICVQRTAWRSRLSIVFADYEGGWRDVPSLDAEVPTWADALLTERAIAQLRERHVGRERFVEAAGWPCLGMSGSFAVEWTGSIASCTVIEHDCAVVLPPRLKRWATYAGMSRLLPLRPIWPGFAINTLFYAGILWLLFAAPFALRRRRRIKRGLCPACGYPVGDSPVCTECGRPFPPPLRAGVRGRVKDTSSPKAVSSTHPLAPPSRERGE